MVDFQTQRANALTVFDRFPGRSETVRRLIAEDERFQSLCQDYLLAVEALGRFAGGSRPDDLERQREYAALVRELVEEIESVIGDLEPSARPEETERPR